MPLRSPLYFTFVGILLFFGFGLFHLAKFETTDEHFWKYERITKYFQGISEGIHNSVWKNTRINDKPGITVTLVSGLGLPFIQSPELHRDREGELVFNNNFTLYHTDQTERINRALRLPILLFNSFFLFFFFWIIQKITLSRWIAASATILIATSAILIGISQVINPDALLWSFGTAGFFSYVALLTTKEKKFIFLTGAFFGLALLSKYTANILFLFSLLFLFIHLLYIEKISDYAPILRKQYLYFLFILLSSWLLFALLMPAVFQKPEHFLSGTILSPVLKPIIWPLGIGITILLCDLIFFRAKATGCCIVYFQKYRSFFYRIPAGILLFLVIFALVNAWTGTPFLSLENIKEESYFEGELVFGQISSENALIRTVLGLSLQSQNFIFSLSPLFLFIICTGWLVMLLGKWRFQSSVATIITITPLIFFSGGLLSDVFVNPRYAILLYPFFAFFGALTLATLIALLTERYPKCKESSLWIITSTVILISGALSLSQTKPFYLTYENFLLPNKYFVTDSWGYGSYEAAQFLNSQPNANNLLIWSDHSAVCQSFVGKCIRDYKINLDQTIPDYFVFSRRGSIRHPFIWDTKSNTIPKHPSEYYYEKMKNRPEWTFIMNGRPKDFVSVVSAEEHE